MTSTGIQFQQDQRFERGFPVPHKVNQMVWDDDKIYMANARGYFVINK